MAMNTLESGPKLDWTRDNQMYERYRIWKKKVEFIFCSALADSTPKQLVSYLKYWMGDQGIPLIEKWESTGKLDYSNSRETPATEGGRRKTLSSGYKLQTYWDLLDEEFKPKGSKKKCFRCGETFSRQHMKECRAQDVTCNGCGIKGHLKKCCKKSGNFPRDSNRQNNQSSSTGPGKMNIASTLPQTEADFFDEKGLPKQYIPQNQHTGSMYVLKKFQGKPNDILFSDNGVEIQHSVSDPDPAPIPTPDFPFQEFLLTEVVNQSQIDYYSISDTSDPRECSDSSRKATKSTDLPLKSGLNSSTHEELREIKGLAVSTAPTQSLRDSNTIFTPDNSDTRESNPGITTGITTDAPSTPTTFPEETDVTAIHSNNYRSVMPTDTQALAVLQDLISDDFQAKNTPSTQRKREDTRSIQRKGEDETFQLIQKIHNQLQEVQWDLQRLHSLHKYKN